MGRGMPVVRVRHSILETVAALLVAVVAQGDLEMGLTCGNLMMGRMSSWVIATMEAQA